MGISESQAFRILDGLASLVYTGVSFTLCYFGCVWLFPAGSHVIIAIVAGATALTSGLVVFRVMKDYGEPGQN